MSKKVTMFYAAELIEDVDYRTITPEDDGFIRLYETRTDCRQVAKNNEWEDYVVIPVKLTQEEYEALEMNEMVSTEHWWNPRTYFYKGMIEGIFLSDVEVKHL